jgi:hypothetical protein
MKNLLKNKKMLLGLLAVGAVGYYFWNKNNEAKKITVILPTVDTKATPPAVVTATI